MIIWTPGFARVLDSPSEILLEMLEPENMAVDEAPVERFLYQNFQVAHAEHRNGALPADPEEVLRLRSHLHEGVPKESPGPVPIQFSPRRNHGEGLAHACPDELFGVRVHDDV